MKVNLEGRLRFAAILLALAACAGAASAQQAPESNTIGNPQLRDFELRRSQAQPAQPEPSTPASPPPSVVTAPPVAPPPVTGPPAARPAPVEISPPAAARPTPGRAPARTAPVRPQESAAPPPAAQPAEAPAAAVPSETQSLPSPAVEAPTAPPEPGPQAAPTERSAPAGDGPAWLYIGLGLLAALLAFAIARKTIFARREDDEGDVVTSFEAEPAAATGGAEALPAPVRPVAAQPVRPAAPQPVPQPAPEAEPSGAITSGLVGIKVRPWIELEFRPDRAVATENDTSVQFELIIRNTGNTGARNVRIEGRMFNAGREEERAIGAFFSEPLMRNCATIPMLLPNAQGAIRSVVGMPRSEVKEITLEGRRLFVPMVAFNVTYEWGESKSGQTSMSYLVGREAQMPTEKMGAFRLDLGPRQYRSVGQRKTNLAVVV